MTSRPSPGPAAPAPTRAVVVAPTPEAGARFAAAFDDTVVLALDAVGPGWPADLPPDASVVVTGIPADRLVAVLSGARHAGHHELLVDVTGEAAPDGAALRGFEVLGRVTLAGVDCVRLRPGADPEALPDLPVARPTGRAAEPSSIPAPTPAPAAATPPPAPSTAPGPSRLPSSRSIGIALAGLVAVVAFGVVVALVTDTGYDGGALTVLLLLVAGNLAYLQRVSGARARAEGRAVKASTGADRARRADADAAAERHAELVQRITELEARNEALAVDVGLLLTSVLHSADAAARPPQPWPTSGT